MKTSERTPSFSPTPASSAITGLTASTRRFWEARAEVMRAVAHPTRLFLLDVLTRSERCVCELTELVGDDMSTVSKHLAVLRRVGLVAAERRANQVFYRLEMSCLPAFFGCVETVVRARAERDRNAMDHERGDS